MSPPITEGTVRFHIPGVEKECYTWYKVVGNLKSSTKRPLVGLHGGPGLAHDYLLPLVDLADAPHNIPVILYDQIGGGRSTRLPEKNGDETFWDEQMFIDEFDNLLKHLGVQDDYDLLGHSWGGMLAQRIAIKQPKGLKRLILTNSLADMELWSSSVRKLLTQLPQETQDIIEKHEREGTTEAAEYQQATMLFFQQFVLRVDPWPAEFTHCLEMYSKDPTVYHTMLGASEFNITGPLKSWNIISELPKIKVPTLVLNGRYDEATDEVVAPLFQHIPQVRWYTFPESSHLPCWEERVAYIKFVAGFLE